jgi:TPR repeat protein
MFLKFAVALLVMAFSAPLFAQEDLQSITLKAEQGDADAQLGLGGMYEEGTGYPQNYSEAAKW